MSGMKMRVKRKTPKLVRTKRPERKAARSPKARRAQWKASKARARTLRAMGRWMAKLVGPKQHRLRAAIQYGSGAFSR
jgi:hypothetical protein